MMPKHLMFYLPLNGNLYQSYVVRLTTIWWICLIIDLQTSQNPAGPLIITHHKDNKTVALP